MTDTETPDTDLGADALSAEEQAAFEEMRTGTAPEPAPQAEPEKQPEPEPAAEPEKEPDVQKLVPHGAFEEERSRRKAAQQEAATAREEMARLRGQLEALHAGRQPPGQTEQEKIDAEKNPIAAIKALEAKLAEQERETEQSAAQRAEFERISAVGSRHAERFAKTQPHFFDTKAESGETVQGAYTFMRAKAAEHLQAQYPQATRDQIIAAVDAVERKHIEESVRDGENAAERLWELAVAQGYKPPVKADPEPKPEPKPQKTEAEKVADLEKAQKGARSLGSVPAGGGENEIGIEALANMDEEEFAAATAGGRWEKLHRQGVI